MTGKSQSNSWLPKDRPSSVGWVVDKLRLLNWKMMKGEEHFTLKVAAKPPNSSWAWDWISLSGDFLSESAGARIRPPRRARLVAVSAYVLTQVYVTSDFWRRLRITSRRTPRISPVLRGRRERPHRDIISYDNANLWSHVGSTLHCWCHHFTKHAMQTKL